MTSIFQSEAWAAFQRDLGRRVFQASGEGWHYVASVQSGRAWRYLYCPYGPEAETPQAFDAALDHLARTARAEKCWFVRIEPVHAVLTDFDESPADALRRRGLREAPHDALPRHTQIIDLTREKDLILQDMAAHNRKRYRNIHKKGVTFTTSTDPEDVELLLPILDDVAQRNRFNRRQDEYLRQAARTLMPLGAATLFVAWLKEKPIEVTLVYDYDGTRVQAHGGMDFEHRRLNAGNAQTVRMILDAKEKGLSRFDLFGITPENANPDHEWFGFTQFKKSFGGRPESYPGTWDLPVRQTLYMVFPLLRSGRDRAITARWAVVRRMKYWRSSVEAPSPFGS